MTPITESRDVVRAALWMIGAILSFSLMAVAGRSVSFALDTFEIMLYRSLVGILVVVIIAQSRGTLRAVRFHHRGLHMARNLLHFAGQNLWFLAITLIPLAQVFALEFTAPLWALLLAPLILGERLTPTRAACAIVGFIGIMIVARPTPDTIGIGIIAAAVAAICFAGSVLCTRKLTRNESLTSILLWMTVLQAGFGIACAGYDGDIALPSMVTLPWLVLIGLGGLAAHSCLTTALSIAPAAVVMPVDFARLPLIAVIGMVIYGEVVDIWVLIGAAVIFAANYANILSETRASRAARRAV
ncbi:DMT family transporter [Rhodobacteraceae bacterium KMM 6894]|nr:DMT family transporter [Rhodobacteraceae bacterium KMM 6894]